MKSIPLFILLIWTFSISGTSGQTSQAEKNCLDCHGKLVQKNLVHQPVSGTCMNCHKSNGKAHPSEDWEGFALTEKLPQLCYNCHSDTYNQAHIHPPVKEGDCLSCHDVHSSPNKHLISQQVPEQCYFCHTDLRKSVETSAVIHGAMKEGTSCLNCHSPHGSGVKKILLAEEQNTCMNCHNKPVKVDDRTIRNMKQFIEGSKYVHGAIENNGCAVCHNPHASGNKNLLTASYPDNNYAPGKKVQYQLCFSCHESSLIEDSTSRETGFRNGDQNLHFMHVSKDKGRSCGNCHNVHASGNLYLLADQVKFGSWEMPVGFKRIEKGGSCSPGCHSEKSYKRQ